MNNYNADKNILRLFDANLNRAQEGIRVIEETARMLLDNDALTRSIKDIRHSLIKIINSENMFNRILIGARGSDTDVLREGETESERTREDVTTVVRANAGRAQEAIRALEEYSKLIFPDMSSQFKNIRFRLYDVEKALVLELHSLNRMTTDSLRIIVVIDHDAFAESSYIDYVRKLIDRGARTIAYRDCTSSDGVFLEQAGKVFDISMGNHGVRIVFDRLDCAMILGIEGFHSEQSELPLKRCREITGKDFIIGYSMTLLEGNECNIENTADYVVLKTPDATEVNFSGLAKVVSKSSIPVLVQGGFTGNSRNNYLDSGVTGFIVRPTRENQCEILEDIRVYLNSDG